MPRSIIKVYFNNGCTTLKFNDFTTAEEITRVVIKGRLSLNELRYKQCFQLRSTKFSVPFKDFDPENLDVNCSNSQIKKIDYFFWLKNNVLIKDWFDLIGHNDENSVATDYWKLQLRIRALSSDLNEIQFKDPVTLSYFYEQIKTDFNLYVAPNLTDTNLIPVLLDLGCLEMRRAFQNMHPNVLDKKINFEYLEKDVGLKRFFPELVLQQKAKNLKKMIIKGLKSYESWNEVDCMLKFLEKLKNIWKYNEETYKCNLGIPWSVPITVLVGYDFGISFRMKNSEEILQSTMFKDVSQIITELDENETSAILKLKISDAKEPLIFKLTDLKEAENLASLIDIFCVLSQKKSSLWLNRNNVKNRNSNHSECSENRKSSDKSFTDESLDQKRGSREKRKNFALILNENDQLSLPESPIENNRRLKIENIVSTELKKCERIQIENLVFYEKLGCGQFGEVYRGIYKNKEMADLDVAIKILKNKEEYEEDPSEKDLVFMRFIREAKIMQNFDHSHIIKLIGVCTTDSLSIVMELAKFGQLRTYLQNNKNQIETKILILYCLQLNNAMEYLESKKYVHRDIAARNILVFNHECIKLADFGLSRELNENFYLASKCKLPIKWMAPESINFRKFTSQSDIWMFGICLWEIMSFGEKPFQGIKNVDVIKLIEEKQRLDKPKSCPNELYNLMLQCWEYDSSRRPNFTQLKNSINFVYSQYQNDKDISCLSTASSLRSDLNLSSNFSTGSNTSSLLSVTMTISRHRSPRLDSISSSRKTFSPPPKPSRFNLNRQNDFSPIRSRDKNVPLISANNESSSDISQLLNKIEISPIKNSQNESPLINLKTIKEVSSSSTSSANDLALRDLTLKFIHNISIFIKLLNEETRLNLDDKLKEIIQSLENLIEAIFSIEIFKSSRIISEQVDEMEKCLNTLVYELKMNRTEKVINCSLEMARNANELFLTLTKL